MTIKTNQSLLKLFSYLIVFISYISLQLGFFYNEDFVGGAKVDFVTYQSWIKIFLEDFKYYFFNYDKLGERHSPVIILYFTLLHKIGLTDTIIRYIHINIAVLIFFYFYKCLKIKFQNTNNYLLILFSSLIFLSPTLRALAIWPDSRIYGLFFFVISLFYYLKFEREKKILNAYYNVFFLAISSYISPNFSIFSIFFFLNYYLTFGLGKNILKIVLLNFALAFPAFYYLFILDVMFLFGGTPGDLTLEGEIPNRLNFFNKIILISSLIFFYILPLIISKTINLNKFNLKQIILALIIFIPSVFFYDYKLDYTGGGIFFHISNKFFENNIFLFLVSFLSIAIIFNINDKKSYNLLLVILLIVSNPQLTIYHKYYDPLLIIISLTIFKLKFNKLSLKKYLILFGYLITFLGVSIIY